ncbi:ankyrin repeat domain-containing protein, partial [bacterium]|nr:ankyrin repeat domain-containing protein [bacterium]
MSDERKKANELSSAIISLSVSAVEAALCDGVEFLSRPPTEFDTWLGFAIKHDCSITVIERLLAAGCDRNARAQSPDQTTALEVAANKENVAALELLLQSGADPDVGRPLVHAINHRLQPESQLRMLTVLLNAGADI